MTAEPNAVQASPTSLTDDEQEIARLMVEGLPNEETILGSHVSAGWPLTLEQAARFMGYRLKRARNVLDANPAFNSYRSKLLEARRRAEQPRNLVTAIAIRDDAGDATAATKTVRLKAAAFIEGNDKPGVNVIVNNQTNIAAISPGYVIRLPAQRQASAPGSLPPAAERLPPRELVTIELEPEP
jgi:hypothetical protein